MSRNFYFARVICCLIFSVCLLISAAAFAQECSQAGDIDACHTLCH